MFQKEIFEKILKLNQSNSIFLSLSLSLLSLPPLFLLSRGRRPGQGRRPRAVLTSPHPWLLRDASRPLHAAPSPCTHAEDCRRRATATNEPSSAVHLFPNPLAPSPGSFPSPCCANGSPPSPSAPLPAPRAELSPPQRPEPPPPAISAAAPRLPRSSLLRPSSRPSNPAASTPTLRWCSLTHSPTPKPAGTPPPQAQSTAGRPSPRSRRLGPPPREPRTPRGAAQSPLPFPQLFPHRRSLSSPENGRPTLLCSPMSARDPR